MDEQLIVNLGTKTLEVTAMISAPMLIGALVIGLVVSVFQAITQINEATLTFIPKMAVVALVFIIASPWMLDVMSHFTIELFENIATYVRN
ncbi:MAG: flagellar biosynthesis protein FliQ [Bdellovibrionales bacterium]|nr:flagellar biosynthesis protein FliQ [Bdellovibrionales bacterium]